MEKYLKLISENPHRMMGVYANTSAKEIMANKSKALAFSKVGKEITFSADLSCVLTPLDRTLEHINEACGQVLSENRLRYALFWFMQMDSTDTEALKQLSLGDMEAALRIWESHETLSSLQNRMICYFLQEDFPSAITTAETIYGQYGETLIQQMDVSSMLSMTPSELSHLFLETLQSEVDLASLYNYCQSSEWKEIIKSLVIQSVNSTLSVEIEQFRNVNHSDKEALKKAGEKLMEQSKKPIQSLRKVLSKEDPQYQMAADRVGEEILNCCIKYVNMSEGDVYDSVHSVYKLLIYAKNTIVGIVAKRRFEENYKMIKPLLGISKEEYTRAIRQPFMRKMRLFVTLGIMLTVGILAIFINGKFSDFWIGLMGSVPVCYIANKIIRLFE